MINNYNGLCVWHNKCIGRGTVTPHHPSRGIINNLSYLRYGVRCVLRCAEMCPQKVRGAPKSSVISISYLKK